MWGAITANIARKLIDAGAEYSTALYKDIGECVKDNIKTTYFYPTINAEILFPKFTKNGLTYGSVNGGVKFPNYGGLKFPTLQFLVIGPNIVLNVRNGGMANDKRSARNRNEHHSDIQKNRI